jgi:hypothetical protein
VSQMTQEQAKCAHLSNLNPPVEHARAHPAGRRGPPTAVPAPIFLPVVRSATGTPTSELRILQGPALSHCGGGGWAGSGSMD